MTTQAVEFNAIVKRYGGVPVIRQLTLGIADHRTTAIVGESGSGKSTLLQLINGLVQPDEGVVSVFGEALDYRRLPEVRRQMGYAVQGAGLFPHLTVRDNIVLVAARAGWSDADIAERFNYLLDLINLQPEFAQRYPHELSGGQQQRVSLCRAMMMNPPLLLLDEPFSALDIITRESIHEEFLRLQAAESRGIILVTHDMSEAEKLADDIVILREGEVLAQGALREVRDTVSDEYVRQLFRAGHS